MIHCFFWCDKYTYCNKLFLMVSVSVPYVQSKHVGIYEPLLIPMICESIPLWWKSLQYSLAKPRHSVITVFIFYYELSNPIYIYTIACKTDQIETHCPYHIEHNIISVIALYSLFLPYYFNKMYTFPWLLRFHYCYGI